MTLLRAGCAAALVASLVMGAGPLRAETSETTRDEARARFEHGLELYRQSQLDAALAEFLRSSELFPTRSAAFNAARIYLELGRHDDALELLERIPAQFADLSSNDRSELERWLAQAKSRVGYLAVRASESRATIVVDERTREPSAAGVIPVAAGTHLVRVHKDGFVPYSTQVEVAPQAKVTVDAKLGALTQAGRLSVSEQRDRAVSVQVDGVELGKTPWEGTVAVGRHVLTLRGEGDLGTPPTPVDVQQNQLTRIALVVEPLACRLRVEPSPRTARVAVDGVEVGRGTWDGPLRCGGHLVEIGEEGFVARGRTVSLAEGPMTIVREVLERDPTSAAFRSKNPPRVTVEADAALLFSPGFGGDLADACGDGCRSSIPLGTSITARAGYRLGMGLGFSADIGFFHAAQRREGVTSTALPYGLPAHPGRTNDALSLTGPTFGGSLGYVTGERFPVLIRLGAGVLVGTASDTRDGTFSTPSGDAYALPERSLGAVKASLYVEPEVRLGYRVTRKVTVEAGVRGFVLAFLGDVPRWGDQKELSLGRCPNADPNVCAGRGTYAPMDLFSNVLFLFGPTLAVRMEL